MSAETEAIWRRLEQIERLLGQRARQEAGNVVDWIALTSTSADGESDAVKTPVPPSAERPQPGQVTVRRVAPFGFWSRPVTNLRALVNRVLGGGSHGAYGLVADPGHGPDDLEPGEVCLYCLADGTIVKLTKVGKIEVNAASGQDIQLNGGTLKVARDTDPTGNGSLVCVVTGPVLGVSIATFVYTPPGGAPQTLATLNFTGSGTGGTASLAGKITDGAPNVKA